MDDLNGIPEKDFEKLSEYLGKKKLRSISKKRNTITKLFQQSYYCST